MTEQEKQLKRIADLLECHLGDTDPVLPDDQDVLEDEFPVHAAMQLVVELMLAARATAEQRADVRVVALQDACDAIFHSRTPLEGGIAVNELLRMAKLDAAIASKDNNHD